MRQPARTRLSRLLIASGAALGAVTIAAGTAGAVGPPVNATGTPGIPPVKHVWTIILENSDESATIAQDSTGTGELTQTLAGQGALITNYFGTGHSSLDNYIALAAAQGPTAATQGDCNGDTDVVGGNRATATFDADGQALDTPAQVSAGKGCTYPANVPTLGTQLTAAGYTWKTYAQGMDDNPPARRTTCQSAQYAGSRNDPTGAVRPFTDNYARKHDPELYFYGVTGDGGTAPKPSCDTEEVGLGQLPVDLASDASTPTYSLIVPDLCNDAHDSQFNGVPSASGTAGCKANSAGPDDKTAATSKGIAQADLFLQYWVPKILASPAFADDGLLMITFDEGTEAVACCNEVTSPNLGVGLDNGTPAQVPGAPVSQTNITRGGGQIGMVAISPFITPGTVSAVLYNHYSYVRTIEDTFALTPARTGIAGSDGKGHIGYAGSQGGSTAAAPASFGSDVFTNPAATSPAPALPESRLVVLLPIAALLMGAGLFTRRQRRLAA